MRCFVLISLVTYFRFACGAPTSAPSVSSSPTEATTTSPTVNTDTGAPTTNTVTGSPTNAVAPTDSPATNSPSNSPATNTPVTGSPSEAAEATSNPTTAVASTTAPTIFNATTGHVEEIPASDIELVCNLRSNPEYERRMMMDPPLCIVVGHEASPTNYTAFYPDVDSFTLVEIDGSFGQDWLDKNRAETYVRVEVGDKTSQWRSRAAGYDTVMIVVPFYTITIVVDMGIVQKIQWDDGCAPCQDTPAKCVNGYSCGELKADCGDGTDETKSDCDLKMYVSWFGTDKNGNYLTSASKRLSRFRGHSLKGAFDTAVKSTVAIANQMTGN